MLSVNTRKVILARAAAGMTISELSEKAGVGRLTISRIEKGTVNANVSTVGKIAMALNVPVEALFIEE